MTKATQYYEDRLVRRFLHTTDYWGKTSSQGKRVSKSCPLTREEIRAYVEGGAVKCLKLMRDSRKTSLREVKDLLDSVRLPCSHRRIEVRR